MIDANALADKSLAGDVLTREESRAVLHWADDDMLGLVNAAYRVRRTYFGNRVKLNFLVNIQSGLCPEDCGYCSQAKGSKAPIDKYRLMSPEDILACAERARKVGAARVCLVASGRGPKDQDIEAVSGAVRELKERYPDMEVCCCMGLLKDGQAAALKDSGVKAYNHNLNTSEKFYGDICSTHSFADRVDTVQRAGGEGLSTCSGALFGMGETDEDRIDVALKLRAMNVDSIPINFLVPMRGTPLVSQQTMTAAQALKILCLFRFLCPSQELRIAGGRELHLRSLQPLGLYVANSIFIGDYLTTEGQAPQADLEMIRDMGFTFVGQTPDTPETPLAERVVFVSGSPVSKP